MSLFKKKVPRKWEFGPKPIVDWRATIKSKYDLVTICKIILTQILNICDIKLTVYTNDNFVSRFDTKDLEIKAILQGFPDLKEYILYLKSSVGPYEILDIIYHEMVHLKQYNNGSLKLNGAVFTWKGQEYKDIPYWDRPWEKEAKTEQYKIQKEVKKLYYE